MAANFKYDAFAKMMQTHPDRLENFYCVTGDELLLRNETIDLIRQRCRDKLYNERISLVLEANGPWEKIQESLQNTSLFADLKILEITLPGGKPGRQGGPALIQLAEQLKGNAIDDVCVILSLPKLDKATQNTKWAKAIWDSAVLIDTPTIAREQLPAWIKQRLAAQKQRVDDETLAMIVDKVEGNLFAAHQEILKLGLMYPEGFIEAQAIHQAVHDVARYDVFQLTNAVLAGDAKRAVRILAGLQNEGEPFVLVLALITREIRTLYTLAIARQQGREISTLFRGLGVFGPRERLVQASLERLQFKQLIGLVQHASDIDRLFKGFPVNGRLIDAWQELQRLVIKIAQPNAL
ncbi:MAG: DNA polymerase III subunit delta [Pelistega sp.]|nr:DNA polymerase III subunit delta [Pelistega sp.]